MTAAWIYGCAGEPDRLALLVDANQRISSLQDHRGCTLHEVRLGPIDVVSLGGMMVSSPLRTALDIALHVEAERALPALRKHAGQARNWTSGCGCSPWPSKPRRGFRTRRPPCEILSACSQPG